MKNAYVMFGTHGLFGDYVEAIHALGGFLARVIRNLEEPDRPPGERFEDRLALYEMWLHKNGFGRRVKVEWMEEFVPSLTESALVGFRGPKLEPFANQLKNDYGIIFPPLVHPSAYVSPMADLEEGVFIGAGAIIGPNVKIGRFSLVNRKASIGHDTKVEEHVIVSPSASVASGVCLRRGCVIGIGSTVIENLEIGVESYVAAGAVVLKNVPARRMVAGVPAMDKKQSPRV